MTKSNHKQAARRQNVTMKMSTRKHKTGEKATANDVFHNKLPPNAIPFTANINLIHGILHRHWLPFSAWKAANGIAKRRQNATFWRRFTCRNNTNNSTNTSHANVKRSPHGIYICTRKTGINQDRQTVFKKNENKSRHPKTKCNMTQA